jgi:hypothetical protein
MADLDKKLHSALGKKGAATKKQVKSEESIAKQEAEILAKRKQILSSGKEIQTHLNKQLAALKLTLAEQKLNYKRIMNDVRESTSAVKKVQGQIKKVKTAEIQAQKKQALADAKAQKEKARWEQAKRGSYKESAKYGADGLAETSFRVSKAISNSKHMNMNAAEAAVQKEIRELRKKKNFVPGSEQYSINRGANGTWSFDLSASAKEQAPQKSVMSRAWDGVKLAVESIREVIGKLLSALSKFLGGVGKVVKGLWKFGKNIAKIALGLPLFNALFAKLASLNGLNAFEFVGASTGAGNATTARTMSRLEDMYGTSGAMSKIAGSRMDILSDASNLRFLQMLGYSPDDRKKLQSMDMNDFAFDITDKLRGWWEQTTGMSMEEIAKNPTDTRVMSAKSQYGATGLSNLMSLNDLLGYNKHFGEMKRDMSNPYVRRSISGASEKAEREYKKTLYGWQDLWINLATKIAPHMNEISRGILSLADAFVEMLFRNGGFQQLVDWFMRSFRRITNWLQKDGMKHLENAFNWIGEKVTSFFEWLDKPGADGKNGYQKIEENINKAINAIGRFADKITEWLDTPDANGNKGLDKVFAIINNVMDGLSALGEVLRKIIDIITFIPRMGYDAGQFLREQWEKISNIREIYKDKYERINGMAIPDKADGKPIGQLPEYMKNNLALMNNLTITLSPQQTKDLLNGNPVSLQGLPSLQGETNSQKFTGGTR